MYFIYKPKGDKPVVNSNVSLSSHEKPPTNLKINLIFLVSQINL